MTLRTRLAVAGGTLLVVIAVAGFFLVRTVETSELQQIDRRLTTAFPVASGYGRPPRSPADRPRQSPGQNRAVTDVYVAVISGGHRTEVLSPTLSAGQEPRVPPTLSTRVRGKLVPQTISSVSGSQDWRAVLASVPGSPDRVLVAVSLAQVDATTAQLRLAVLAAGGLVLLVLAAAAFWVERLGIRPVAKVAEAADAIVAGDRDRRVAEVAPRTEAAHLVRAFNVMLDEQRAIEDHLRQFVADASHELRTPVTAIRGVADLWRDGHLREGAELDDAMRRVGREGARMADLVEKLLLLARLDSHVPIRPQHIDVGALIHQVVLDAGTTNPTRQFDVELSGLCWVEGDSEGLRQVIGNLVTNALVHTPPSSPIAVRTLRHGDNVAIEVADHGPGMDPPAAAHAFDRFWRADASRGRPGSGLGLPIVAAIVAAHGGEVAMRTDAATGTSIRVVLPAVQPKLTPKVAADEKAVVAHG